MVVAAVLWGVAALLAIAALGIAAQRFSAGSRFVYFGCVLVCLALLVPACDQLLAGAGAQEGLVLPVGLPWMGAHFAVDGLSAFFLAVANLGGAAASLYALGYGQHGKRRGAFCPSTQPSWRP
jgi:formate hydrogenlyase subunit 3/multisubunit Na+/H+ antiporter MnhD subunit